MEVNFIDFIDLRISLRPIGKAVLEAEKKDLTAVDLFFRIRRAIKRLH